MKIKLTKYLKPYTLYVILAPLMMALEVTMDLQQPALMATVVNDGILNSDVPLITRTCLKMLAAAAIGTLGGFGCTVFSELASQNYGADLRAALFGKIGSFSFYEINLFSTGSLVTRLTNDVVQLQNIVGFALRIFVRAPLLCIGGMIMVISINPRYGVVLAVCVPAMLLPIIFIFIKTTPLFLKLQKKLDRLNVILQENLSGIRVVKAFVRGEHEMGKFSKANDDLTRTSVSAMKLMAVAGPIMMLVMNAVVVAVIYIGGFEVQAERMRIGDIMAVIAYMTQILMSLMILSMRATSIPRARVSAERIRQVLATEPKITDGEISNASGKGKIVFENVSFSYDNGSMALKNISLKINPGEHTGLLGHTGSGKSTLINLIMRFYDPVSGRVLLDDIDVKDYTLFTLRSQIGLVLQNPELFSGTIAENIRWGSPGANSDEVAQAAEAAQADEYISAMPSGYDSIIGQKGLTLSGGQKQRACIARALIKKPKILIMDDSTSALDFGTEKNLNDVLSQDFSDITRITIAQRISSVIGADKIYLLASGEIAGAGTHGELMASSELYRDIYASQADRANEKEGDT
ncbi:MAG: ABC transporter ATP-binding protein/permease [Oscillospiraceae bacterium]|nr:ABC transporter ATP-binding protein/permease [Oscillospiraceae bacterium]